jgi:transposase
MKKRPLTTPSTPDLSGLSTAELLSVVAGLQQQLAQKEAELEQREDASHHQLKAKDAQIQQRDHYIQMLEELLRWKRAQQFAASSEKTVHQIHLFDEAELEAEIDALRDQLPDDIEEMDAPKPTRRRGRGFSDQLLRERIPALAG